MGPSTGGPRTNPWPTCKSSFHPPLPQPHWPHFLSPHHLISHPSPMAFAGAAAASLSSSAPSILLVSAVTPPPRLLPTSSILSPVYSARPKRPPTLSCNAAAATVAAAAAGKPGSWRDLCSLNAWVVRDYRRLVDAVGALEPRLRGLTDERLRAKTDEFRARLARGETLADVQAGTQPAAARPPAQC